MNVSSPCITFEGTKHTEKCKGKNRSGRKKEKKVEGDGYGDDGDEEAKSWHVCVCVEYFYCVRRTMTLIYFKQLPHSDWIENVAVR